MATSPSGLALNASLEVTIGLPYRDETSPAHSVTKLHSDESENIVRQRGRSPFAASVSFFKWKVATTPV